MKPIATMLSVVAVLFAALTLTAPLAAQVSPQKTHQTHYIVIDLGTLGGSFALAGGLNDWGSVTGFSYLTDDAAVHGFFWRNGVMTEILTLGGPDSEVDFPSNDWNQVVGHSDTSTPDPLGEDYCGFGTGLTCVPFLWQKGVMTPLSLLGGNNGAAYEINNWGVIVGEAENSTQDPECTPPQLLQPQPVWWYNGKVHQLPILSEDTAGAAVVINDLGQIAGVSGTCPDPFVHAVFWQNGRAIDMGNLGGTTGNYTADINNRGQVVGESDVSQDVTAHGFVWDKHSGMKDLGTMPGDYSSSGDGINNLGQIVGGSCDADGNCRAVLWQNGAITDLNTLIPPDSNLYLLEATGTINDLGEIAGEAYDISSGEIHPFLLIPCGWGHTPGCQNSQAAGMTNGVTHESRKVVRPEKIRQQMLHSRGRKSLYPSLRSQLP